MHRLVNDLESHKGRQFETLQADADLGGTLSDHADVRRGGENFVDMACTLLRAVVNQRQRISMNVERVERQVAQLDGQPLEQVVTDLT